MRKDVSISGPIAPPKCYDSPLLGEAVTNAKVDEVAQQALKQCADYCSSDNGWKNEDLGMDQDGILSASRDVKGFTFPAYKCKLTVDVPARFNGNLRLAAFEAIAPWLGWSMSRQLNVSLEQSAVLMWTKGGASASWVGMIPDGDPKVKPQHLILARGIEAKVGKSEVIIRCAESSVPEDVAKSLMASRKDLLNQDRERFQVNATQVRVFEENGKAKVEVQVVFHLVGDQIPAALKMLKSIVKKDILCNQPGKLSRWHTIYSEGCIPRIIETSGGHPAARIQPASVSIAGESWMLCSSIQDPLREVLDGL